MKTISATVDFRFIYLPYCLQRQKDGSYVILNRKYKPLGFTTNNYIKYEEYPISSIIKDITPALAKKLSCDGNGDIKDIYLYDDSCIPAVSGIYMDLYLKKLEILSNLTVEIYKKEEICKKDKDDDFLLQSSFNEQF